MTRPPKPDLTKPYGNCPDPAPLLLFPGICHATPSICHIPRPRRRCYRSCARPGLDRSEVHLEVRLTGGGDRVGPFTPAWRVVSGILHDGRLDASSAARGCRLASAEERGMLQLLMQCLFDAQLSVSIWTTPSTKDVEIPASGTPRLPRCRLGRKSLRR